MLIKEALNQVKRIIGNEQEKAMRIKQAIPFTLASLFTSDPIQDQLNNQIETLKQISVSLEKLIDSNSQSHEGRSLNSENYDAISMLTLSNAPLKKIFLKEVIGLLTLSADYPLIFTVILHYLPAQIVELYPEEASYEEITEFLPEEDERTSSAHKAVQAAIKSKFYERKQTHYSVSFDGLVFPVNKQWIVDSIKLYFLRLTTYLSVVRDQELKKELECEKKFLGQHIFYIPTNLYSKTFESYPLSSTKYLLVEAYPNQQGSTALYVFLLHNYSTLALQDCYNYKKKNGLHEIEWHGAIGCELERSLIENDGENRNEDKDEERNRLICHGHLYKEINKTFKRDENLLIFVDTLTNKIVIWSAILQGKFSDLTNRLSLSKLKENQIDNIKELDSLKKTVNLLQEKFPLLVEAVDQKLFNFLFKKIEFWKHSLKDPSISGYFNVNEMNALPDAFKEIEDYEKLILNSKNCIEKIDKSYRIILYLSGKFNSVIQNVDKMMEKSFPAKITSFAPNPEITASVRPMISAGLSSRRQNKGVTNTMLESVSEEPHNSFSS